MHMAQYKHNFHSNKILAQFSLLKRLKKSNEERCFGCSHTHLLNLNFKVRSSQHAFTELIVCICVGLAIIVLMLLRLRGGNIWFHPDIIRKLYKKKKLIC